MYFFNIIGIIRKNYIEIHFQVKIYVSTLYKNMVIELDNSLLARILPQVKTFHFLK